MPASAITFNGQTTSRPSVLAYVDDRGLQPIGRGASLTVCIVGTAEGGEPKKPEYFSNVVDALARYRGGDIAKVLRYVFAPGKERVAPGLVCLVRVNPATRATTTLKNSSTDIITVTAVNYGQRDNGTWLAVAAGTISNSKKVTVSDGINTYVRDNIQRPVLTLAYTGSSMAITVNATGITATVVGGSGTSQTALFADYPTAKKMVDFFAAQTGYTATLGPVDPELPLTDAMDYLSAVSALSQTLYANNQAIVDYLNSGVQPLVTAAKIAGVGLLVDNTTANRIMTGGGEGATANGDWQSAFDALGQERVGLIACLSPTLAIQQMLLNHVTSVSINPALARRGYVGAATGQKTSDLGNYRTISDAMNSDRISVVAQGMTTFDDFGNKQVLAPYYMTALAAALQSSYGPGEAITNKAVNVIGLEWEPTEAEKNMGIDFGLLLFGKDFSTSGFTCIRGVSSWRSNAKFNRVETSCGLAIDEMLNRVTDKLQTYRGQKASPITVRRMLEDVRAELVQLTAEEILVGNEANPSFKSLTGKLQGDRVDISFAASPVIPINFIPVTVSAVPFSGTFTLATN